MGVPGPAAACCTSDGLWLLCVLAAAPPPGWGSRPPPPQSIALLLLLPLLLLLLQITVHGYGPIITGSVPQQGPHEAERSQAGVGGSKQPTDC